MTLYFGSSAVREYGDCTDNSDFSKFCDSASDQNIKRVFRLCEQQLSTGNQFAPTVGALSQMSTMITDDEYYSILDAVKNSRDETTHEDWRIEWIIRRHSRDIQLSNQLQVRKLVSSLYRRACHKGEEQCRPHDIKLINHATERDMRMQCSNVGLPAHIQNIIARIDNIRQGGL